MVPTGCRMDESSAHPWLKFAVYRHVGGIGSIQMKASDCVLKTVLSAEVDFGLCEVRSWQVHFFVRDCKMQNGMRSDVAFLRIAARCLFHFDHRITAGLQAELTPHLAYAQGKNASVVSLIRYGNIVGFVGAAYQRIT